LSQECKRILERVFGSVFWPPQDPDILIIHVERDSSTHSGELPLIVGNYLLFEPFAADLASVRGQEITIEVANRYGKI
jgi:hypothetical protein